MSGKGGRNMQISREAATVNVTEASPRVASAQNAHAVQAAPVSEEKAGPSASHEEIAKSVDNVRKQLDLMKETNVQMEFDKDIDRVIVKYVSASTGELVNQIPSEKFVEFEKEFVKTIGLLFDQKA
jgi:uncharacterized FlaG/YvyC family protein